MVAHACHPSHVGKILRWEDYLSPGRSRLQQAMIVPLHSSPGDKGRPCLQKTNKKKLFREFLCTHQPASLSDNMLYYHSAIVKNRKSDMVILLTKLQTSQRFHRFLYILCIYVQFYDILSHAYIHVCTTKIRTQDGSTTSKKLTLF